jgi:hypothetical protein
MNMFIHMACTFASIAADTPSSRIWSTFRNCPAERASR